MTDTPKSPREFVGAMLRSCVEADRFATEYADNLPLRDAEVQAAVNGFVAAVTMDHLRRHAPNCADSVVALLVNVLSSSHLGIAARRIATGLDYDHAGWIAQVDARIANSQQSGGGS
ncbi:hypothetical protein ACFY97_18440 [Streptomyces klenkii]|uniref:hypothetical protein n=1 Tax=Streptomyces klenkii TaxID=1420899 RepID=UPI0036E20255